MWHTRASASAPQLTATPDCEDAPENTFPEYRDHFVTARKALFYKRTNRRTPLISLTIDLKREENWQKDVALGKNKLEYFFFFILEVSKLWIWGRHTLSQGVSKQWHIISEWVDMALCWSNSMCEQWDANTIGDQIASFNSCSTLLKRSSPTAWRPYTPQDGHQANNSMLLLYVFQKFKHKDALYNLPFMTF